MISSLADTNGLALRTAFTKGSHPLNDPAFAEECPDARAQALERWEICMAIQNAPRTLVAIASHAGMAGLPVSKLKRLYYDWIRPSKLGIVNDWNVLINRAKYPEPNVIGTPPAFAAFYRNLYESHQRDQTGAQARRVLMAMLAAWERDPGNPQLAIPGYDRPPQRRPIQGHPDGWSKRSLYRLLPNRYERTLRRQGPKAASNLLPNIHTSRVGLNFGQIIYFDDQVLDTYINLTGRNTKAMRPLAFNALEALTGSCFEMGLKPQLWDGKERTKTELDQLDFFWFVMLVLTKHGYNPKTGTTLVFEHGTANVDKTGKFDEDIKRITNGAVTVDRSGLFNKPAFKAMLFEGKSSGNFRFKAPVESFFNLLRNWHAGLPAPTGLDRHRAPEESHGLIAYNDRQLKLIDKLPAELFLRLRRPVTEWEDFCRIARAINRAIDADRDHELEGWIKLGFTGQRYRLSLDTEQWLSEEAYQQIPAEHRAALDHIVRTPGYFQSYRLSRGEAFAMHADQLTKFPMQSVPLVAPDRAWEDVTVHDNLEMVIDAPDLDSEPLRYIAKVETANGYEVILKRGKTYKRLLNIFDPTYMWIAESEGSRKGALIGVAKRLYVPCKIDHGQILEQLGDHGHIKSVESKEVHTRMESEAAIRQRMNEHNRAVSAGGPVTPEEKAATRARERELDRAARKVAPEQIAAVMTSAAVEAPTEPEFTPEQIAELFGSTNHENHD